MKKKQRLASLLVSSVLATSTMLSGVGIISLDPIVAQADAVVAPELVGDLLANEDETQFSGKLNKKGKVDVVLYSVDDDGTIKIDPIVDLTKTINTETDAEGNFSVTINKQLKNTKVMFLFSDITSGVTSKKVYTIQGNTTDESIKNDENAPQFEKIHTTNGISLSNSNKIVSGVVDQPAEVVAMVGEKVVGKANTTKNDNNQYEFTASLDAYQEAGTVVTLHAQNASGSSAVINIFVKDDGKNLSLLEEIVVTNASTTVEGTVNKPARVQLFDGHLALNATPLVTEADGTFKIGIRTFAAGSELKLVITNPVGNTSSPLVKTLKVQDAIAPQVSVLSAVKNTSSYIDLEVNEEDAIISMEVSEDGNSFMPIQLEKDESVSSDDTIRYVLQEPFSKNTKLKISATDAAGNSSEEFITVEEDITPPVLLTEMVAVGDHTAGTVFKGQLNKQGTVQVLMNDQSILDVESVSTSIDGSFGFTIPNQLKNTKLVIVFTDLQNNKTETVVTVQDTTKPSFGSVSTIYNTDRIISGVVTEAASVTAMVGDTVVGKATTQLQKNSEGKRENRFTIVLSKALEEDSVVTLQAKETSKSGFTSNIYNVVVIDNPNPLNLEKKLTITDSSTSVEGKVNRPATVQLLVDGTPLNAKAATTDENGNFKISIKKLKAGTDVKVKMVDLALNEKIRNFTVADSTAPVITKVNAISNTSYFIEGKVSEQAVVTIKGLNNGNDQYVLTDEEGNFSLELDVPPTQKSKITLFATDDAGIQTVKNTVLTVKEDKKAPKLVAPKKIEISDKDRVLEGQMSKKGTVALVDGKSKVIGNAVETDHDGQFTLTFKKQSADSQLFLLLSDAAGNQTKVAVSIMDETKPVIQSVETIYNTMKVIKGTVSEPATISALVENASVGKVSVKKANADGEYAFTLELKKYLEAGDEVALQATDFAKPANISNYYKVEVESDESDFKLIEGIGNVDEYGELIITNHQTTVQGQLNKPGIVQLQLANGTLLHKKAVETDENGEFNIKIKKQAAGADIELVIKDVSGREVDVITTTVVDMIPPEIKKIETIYETSNFIEGQITKESQIYIDKFVGGKWQPVEFVLNESEETEMEDEQEEGAATQEVQNIFTDPTGHFYLELEEKIAKNTTVRISAISMSDISSEEKIITVKEDKKAPKLLTPKKIEVPTLTETTIDGQLDEQGTVDVLVNGKSILIDGKVTTDAYGIFTVKIPKQSARTKLVFVFSDMRPGAPNTSKKTVTVK